MRRGHAGMGRMRAICGTGVGVDVEVGISNMRIWRVLIVSL
jgi:hypothetical protein